MSQLRGWRDQLVEDIRLTYPGELPRVARRLAIRTELVVLRSKLLTIVDHPADEAAGNLPSLIPLIQRLEELASEARDAEFAEEQFSTLLAELMASLSAASAPVAKAAKGSFERIEFLRTDIT